MMAGMVLSITARPAVFTTRTVKKIIELAKEFAEELGEKSMIGFVTNFNTFKRTVVVTEDEIALTLYGTKKQGNDYTANALAWFALEEVAFRFQDFLSENNINLFA